MSEITNETRLSEGDIHNINLALDAAFKLKQDYDLLTEENSVLKEENEHLREELRKRTLILPGEYNA